MTIPSSGTESDRTNPGMNFNLYNLEFNGSHRELEKPFSKFYFQISIFQVRLAIFSAIILCSVYGIYDYWSGAAQNTVIWIARFVVMIPACVVVFALSFNKKFKHWMQPILSTGILVAGAAMISMIVAAPTNLRFAYLAGFVQIVFYTCTLLRIRFIWAASVTWMLVLLYTAMDIWTIKSEPSLLLANLFFLTGTALMGMMASYAIEYYTRREFFLLHQLKLKSNQLSAANQHLEQRVNQRTKDLARLNASLKVQIGKQKAAEKALLKSKERYRQIVDNVTDYLCVHNFDGLILEANRQFRDKLGYGPDDGGGLRLFDFVESKYYNDIKNYLNEIRHNRQAHGLLTLKTRDGKKRLVEYSSQVALDENENLLVFGSGRDITERWKAEKALTASQQQFQSIFESTPAGIVILDTTDNRIINANPAAASMIGLPVERIIGQHLDRYIYNQTTHNLGNHKRQEAILKAKNNKRLPILRNEHTFTFMGKPHIVVSFLDISSIKAAETAKRQAEMRLAQAQNLQALGTLAGGIAHDFNNILYGMLGFTELALDDAPPDSSQEANLQEVLAGGKRAKDLIAQILAFSRQSKAEKKPLNLVPLIKEVSKLVRASLPATIRIETAIEDCLDSVMANASQIHQVILNLCTNAGHAIQNESGTIKITAKNVTLAAGRTTSHGILQAGRYVNIAVSDDGCGMSPNVLRRIFEPFFSTKEQGKGTGMGLAVVHGIVKGHGGMVDVQSEPGWGTTFKIYLPALMISNTKDHDYEKELPRGSETILFVDDERPLRTMVANTLGKLGYTVKICKNGEQAWKIFKQQPESFDIIITDWTMPQMTGLELAGNIRRLRKDIPIILCTGYNNSRNKQWKDEKLSIAAILNKPIDRRNLASTIKKALDKRQ